MSYPGFDTPIPETALGVHKCPLCQESLSGPYYYCNYDCYADSVARGTHNNIVAAAKENRELKANYPIKFDRDFKHIPPKNTTGLRFDDDVKRWVPNKGDL